MIQRIQSVYLALAAVMMGLMFVFPLGDFLGGIERFHLTPTGLYSSEGVRVAQTLPMAMLSVVATLLPLVVIFLYRDRRLQMRLCVAEMILLFGEQLMVCLWLWRSLRSMSGFSPCGYHFSVASALPIVAFVVVWLAMKSIARDEALVRSVDRIR
ncbi:membrane protein [Bacteroidia bacterium]|nr:membrane protein [Bacteroidia bacterium]